MAREQKDVTKGQEDVTKGQEQVELEEPMEVEEAGAVKSRDGGDPRASPPLWPPKPLPVGGEERLLLEKQVEVEEVAAVKEQEASDMVPLLDRPLLAEEEVKEQVEVEEVAAVKEMEACAQAARPS